MEYILTGKIRFERPIVFLCGPVYEKNSAKDRRNVLRQGMHKICSDKKKEVLPLIVDDFLTEENFDYQTFSMQLMEELCATIANETYIFLDSLSSATELGIFSSSAYSNKIRVLIPKKSDICNKGNVGQFIRKSVLENPNANIVTIEYRPKLERVAQSTYSISEYYYFNENKLPEIVKQQIEKDAEEREPSEIIDLILMKKGDFPQKVN